MPVDDLPCAGAAPPDRARTCQEDKMFQEVNQIEAASIERIVRPHVLPRDHYKKVEIEPPDHQQGKIQRAQSAKLFIPLQMRLHGQRPHHGDQMQEEDDVSHKRSGDFLPKKYLE